MHQFSATLYLISVAPTAARLRCTWARRLCSFSSEYRAVLHERVPIYPSPNASRKDSVVEQVPCRVYPDRDGESLIRTTDRERCKPITYTISKHAHMHAIAHITQHRRAHRHAAFKYPCPGEYKVVATHRHKRNARKYNSMHASGNASK